MQVPQESKAHQPVMPSATLQVVPPTTGSVVGLVGLVVAAFVPWLQALMSTDPRGVVLPTHPP